MTEPTTASKTAPVKRNPMVLPALAYSFALNVPDALIQGGSRKHACGEKSMYRAFTQIIRVTTPTVNQPRIGSMVLILG